GRGPRTRRRPEPSHAPPPAPGRCPPSVAAPRQEPRQPEPEQTQTTAQTNPNQSGGTQAGKTWGEPLLQWAGTLPRIPASFHVAPGRSSRAGGSHVAGSLAEGAALALAQGE